MFQAELVRKDAERKGRHSERTLISYDELWRLYLDPLATRPLNTITLADVEDVLSAAPSAWRAHDVLKVLRMAMRAVKAGKIAANPATGINGRSGAATERDRRASGGG